MFIQYVSMSQWEKFEFRMQGRSAVRRRRLRCRHCNAKIRLKFSRMGRRKSCFLKFPGVCQVAPRRSPVRVHRIVQYGTVRSLLLGYKNTEIYYVSPSRESNIYTRKRQRCPVFIFVVLPREISRVLWAVAGGEMAVSLSVFCYLFIIPLSLFLSLYLVFL